MTEPEPLPQRGRETGPADMRGMRQVQLIQEPGADAEDLAEVLRRCEATVARLRSLDAALHAAERSPPDLIVLHADHDEVWATARRLKEDPRTQAVPLLVFRDHPAPADKRMARQVGCESCDGRPLDPERLLAKVTALFRDRPRPPLLNTAPLALPEVKAEPKARLLVVDDEPALLELMEVRLGELGYAVTAVSSGPAALASLERTTREQHPFDLVLLDLSMPRMSGLEVLWQIRDRHPAFELPVIMITGKTGTHDLVAALELGANDYITKPVDFTIVTARLGIHLQLTRTTRQLRRREEQYRLLAENSTDMVTRESPDGTWLYVSPASVKLLGFSPEELVGRSAYSLLHPDDFESLAHTYDTLLDSPDSFALRYRMRRKDGRWIWTEASMQVLRDPDGDVTEIQSAVRDVTAQVERQSTVTEDMMVRFGRIAEFRSGETRGHIQRMGHACAILARRAGLPSRVCDNLRLAATLHDIGNIVLPLEILNKPGPLTTAEYEQVKASAEVGYELLRGSGNEVLDLAATICWYHHEHWDGSGYPRGRRGRGIPVEARIALVCDVFDMMTSDRPYRPALSVAEAVATLETGRGTQFDPDLVELFLTGLPEILALRERFPDGPMGTPGAAGGLESTTAVDDSGSTH